MLKIQLRPNLKYPLQLLINSSARDIENILINYFFDDTISLIYTPLMFLSEFFSGLIIHLYQKQSLKKNKTKKMHQYTSKDLYSAKFLVKSFTKEYVTMDSTTKIMFLIFIVGFYDFVQFMISFHTPKFINISRSIGKRLSGFLTIFDALFYYYVLRLPTYKHEFFSLIVIGICLLLVISTEFIFQEINIFLSYFQFINVFLIMLVEQFCSAMVDSNEKYLFEYNSVNPFFALMFEGIFGFILFFIYGIYKSPFTEIINFHTNASISEFTIFIFALILYTVLSGLKNSFRVLTTKIYSPMTTTFLDYIFNPIYMIIDFSFEDDFIIKGKKDYTFFLINLFLGLIISFFGCVYNEFIILFCCSLDKDTYKQVSIRSNAEEKEIFTLQDVYSVDEESLA